MSQNEFILCFFLLAVLTLTNTAGNGGAGILIPISIGLYHFDTKSAIALSNVSLVASGVMKYTMTLNESHPLKNGQGIVHDYNYAMLALPTAIVGANLGSLVNLMAAEELVLVLFLCVTIYTAWQAIRKYRKLRNSEKNSILPCDKTPNSNSDKSFVASTSTQKL